MIESAIPVALQRQKSCSVLVIYTFAYAVFLLDEEIFCEFFNVSV